MNAGQIFVYTENLSPATVSRDEANSGSSGSWQSLASQAIDMSAEEDGWALLSDVGSNLRKLGPAFDPRTFGHKQLSQLIRSQPNEFQLNETHAQGGPTVIQVKSRGG